LKETEEKLKVIN